MTNRAGMIWAPKIVMDEVDSVMREKKIKRRADGLKEVIESARVGREVERIARFRFGGAPAQPPVDTYFPRIVRRKR